MAEAAPTTSDSDEWLATTVTGTVTRERVTPGGATGLPRGPAGQWLSRHQSGDESEPMGQHRGGAQGTPQQPDDLRVSDRDWGFTVWPISRHDTGYERENNFNDRHPNRFDRGQLSREEEPGLDGSIPQEWHCTAHCPPYSSPASAIFHNQSQGFVLLSSLFASGRTHCSCTAAAARPSQRGRPARRAEWHWKT